MPRSQGKSDFLQGPLESLCIALLEGATRDLQQLEPRGGSESRRPRQGFLQRARIPDILSLRDLRRLVPRREVDPDPISAALFLDASHPFFQTACAFLGVDPETFEERLWESVPPAAHDLRYRLDCLSPAALVDLIRACPGERVDGP